MELQEQVTTLDAQVKQYELIVDNLNNEKIALDQMLVKSLKETLNATKELLIKDKAINGLNNQIQVLLKEKETISAELSDTKEKLALMASNNNISE